MEVLIGLLKSAILLNQYDLVYTLARLVLKINKNLMLGWPLLHKGAIEKRASRSSEEENFVTSYYYACSKDLPRLSKHLLV